MEKLKESSALGPFAMLVFNPPTPQIGGQLFEGQILVGFISE
jgi:hypothetical protein